jgi:peptide deformylase
MSELLQHEIDHLDGILCTQRAIDLKSFKIRAI